MPELDEARSKGYAEGEARWEKRYRRIAKFAVGCYVFIPPLIGWLLSLFTGFGDEVSHNFFSVVAEGLLPVLLVTSILQYSLVARRELELEPSKLMEWRAAQNLSAAFTLFLVGEGAALYAVAEEASSTFLVVTSLVAGLTFLGDLAFATRHQFGSGIEKYLPGKEIERMARRERKARLEAADRLEQQARALRGQADDEPQT